MLFAGLGVVNLKLKPGFHIHHIEFKIDDPKTGEKHTLSGIMDRIDKNADGGFEIIDYKTKRKMPGQKEIDNDLQMSIYQLGLVKKWPHIDPNKIKLSFYFLKHGEKISTSRTKEQVEETRNFILDTIRDINEKIKDGNNFPPTPSPLCDWCEYRQMCPMWKHLYRKQNEKDLKEIVKNTVWHEIAHHFGMSEIQARQAEIKRRKRRF